MPPMFDYLDCRAFLHITKAVYVWYGYYGQPNACCWIVPGTYMEP